jgi:DNA-binding transcriptional MerR regulator
VPEYVTSGRPEVNPAAIKVNVNSEMALEYTIGELAARFGLATHVLRHWEDMGLLSPARRVAGRRVYGPAHMTRVAEIMLGKDAGFSLEQLRELFAAPDRDRRREVLRAQLAQVRQRIARASSAAEPPSMRLTRHPASLKLSNARSAVWPTTTSLRQDRRRTAARRQPPGRSGASDIGTHVVSWQPFNQIPSESVLLVAVRVLQGRASSRCRAVRR